MIGRYITLKILKLLRIFEIPVDILSQNKVLLFLFFTSKIFISRVSKYLIKTEKWHAADITKFVYQKKNIQLQLPVRYFVKLTVHILYFFQTKFTLSTRYLKVDQKHYNWMGHSESVFNASVNGTT